MGATTAPRPQQGTPGVATDGQLPPGGVVQGTLPRSFGAAAGTGGSGATLSTIGGFSVPVSPQATGAGSTDVPGTAIRQNAELLATPTPANVNPASPGALLPASPAPANAAPALPLPATPAPLNAAPAAATATPLLSTPAPLSATPATPVPGR